MRRRARSCAQDRVVVGIDENKIDPRGPPEHAILVRTFMDDGQDETPSSALNRLARLLRSSALFIAIGYIGLYLSVALLRVNYPFDLEWMEGSSVEHVRRLLTGRPLYVAPSLEFIPHNYPPLYFYVSAAVAQVLGVTPTSLRLVSIVSSLASFVAIYLLVKRETGNLYAAGLAAGLFAATFRIGGAWFDIARVDSLFLALFLAGVYLIRAHTKHSMLVCAGLLFSLAMLTKQTALVMTGPVILYLAIMDVRRALLLIGVVGLVAGGGTLVLDYLSDGWYKYYVFELPTQFAARLVRPRLVLFWTDDILSRLDHRLWTGGNRSGKHALEVEKSGWVLSRGHSGYVGGSVAAETPVSRLRQYSDAGVRWYLHSVWYWCTRD